jgi:hypothetical protein
MRDGYNGYLEPVGYVRMMFLQVAGGIRPTGIDLAVSV